MKYTSIEYAVSDRIATVTLNRPERRNALDDAMIKELLEVFNSANRNSEVRAVILTGSGASFCAGMDLDYLKRYSELGHNENLEDARNLMKLLSLIYTLKKPVVAAVNGPAMGGGCGLAAACDFVFAGKSKAKIGAPEVRLGFLPALILLFLIKRMGEGSAKEFVLRGDTIDAEAASLKSLVTEVVDDDKLTARTIEFTLNLCATTSPSSILLTKDLFSRFSEMSMGAALEYAANLNALTRKTEDFKKGIESFMKKEKLEW
ncbi:MAG TPA: enoyl-CoA hydratase-related protein [Bacteroidota bacterium]|jgi:methylglutaconyl-CoA hydratase|nr:enoyl-CoA hydratase-related protein [Bacteroidota bacterium]